MNTSELTEQKKHQRRQRYIAESDAMYECWHCHEVKPIKEFYFNASRSTGHDGYCKKCDAVKHKKLAQKRRSSESKAVKVTRTALKKSNKNAITYIVQYAVNHGIIEKPDICSVCGNSGKIEGHHPNGKDAAHIFDIQWVCHSCHMKIHSKDWREFGKLSYTHQDDTPPPRP